MSNPAKMKVGVLQVIDRGELIHVSGKKVPYEIVRGWDLRSSVELSDHWRASWTELLAQVQEKEPDPTKQIEIFASIMTEDAHWDWFQKAIRYSTPDYEWFHLYADGRPQAACLIYHPEKSALGTGHIFSIKFVSVAPWNRTCDLRPREFGHLGEIILRAAQRFAVKELRLRPGFCLHSLPQAEGFYTKLRMLKIPGREDAQSLAYFELPEQNAIELMEAC